MFLAFKTHFLSSWAKRKIFVVQTHTCADLLPLYSNCLTTFPNSRGPERSKLAEWRGLRGEEGTVALSVMVQCIIMAAMDDTCQCTQQWMHKSVFKNTVTTPGAPAHCAECSGCQLKPNYDLDRETGLTKSCRSVDWKSARAPHVLFWNWLTESVFAFLYNLGHWEWAIVFKSAGIWMLGWLVGWF